MNLAQVDWAGDIGKSPTNPVDRFPDESGSYHHARTNATNVVITEAATSKKRGSTDGPT